MAQAGLFAMTVRVAGRLCSDRGTAWSGPPAMLAVNMPASCAYCMAELETRLLGSLVPYCPMQLCVCSTGTLPPTGCHPGREDGYDGDRLVP